MLLLVVGLPSALPRRSRPFGLCLLIGTLGYIVLASSVMLFYQDDPARMSLVERQKFNTKYINKLAQAIQLPAQQTVFAQLGPPDITEAKQVGQQIYQIVFYRTRQVNRDNVTTKDECTGLLFVDQQLVSWQRDSYQQYLAAK